MLKKVASLATTICILASSCAPYTIQLIERQEMMDSPDCKIVAVITKSGEYLEFDPHAVLKDSLIVGRTVDGPSISMALSDIDSIYVMKKQQLDEEAKQARARTACCIMGGSLVLGAIIAIIVWIDSIDWR